MPKYYFHLEDGQSGQDDTGAELADEAAAKLEAASLCGAMLMDQPEILWAESRTRLVVANERGMALFAIEVNTVVGAEVLPWLKRETA